MVFPTLRMMFGRRNAIKVCIPDMGMEELEKIVSFDASIGDLFSHDVLANASAAPHSTHADHRMVLITDTLAATDGVRQAIPQDAQVVVVDSRYDNLESINKKITDAVNTEGAKIGALAVLAHAEKGKLILGTDRIDLANAQQFTPQLEELGRNFADKGQIQLFGCSVAGDVFGQGLVEVISVATNTDVFASTNPTGSGEGKDWTLEYASNPFAAPTSVIDADAMAAIPLDLEYGDVVITKGVVEPFTKSATAQTVNLGQAFFLYNNVEGQAMTAWVVANPSSSELWDSISVDTALAEDLGLSVTPAPPSLQLQITGGTDGQINALLGTLQGEIKANAQGQAQILLFAQEKSVPPDGLPGDWASAVLDVSVLPTSFTINVPPTEDEPLDVSQNTTTAIAGINIRDAEPGTPDKLNVTVSVSHGTVTVQVPSSTPGQTPTSYTNSVITFTDTLTNVNTALAGLKYTPTEKYYGSDTLTVTVVDQAQPQPGMDQKTVEITISNVAPAIAAPSSVTIVGHSQQPLTGIGVSDPDIGSIHQIDGDPGRQSWHAERPGLCFGYRQ